MKISHVFCLTVLALIVSVKIDARPIGEIQDGGDLLLLDNGTTGQQNENGVKITETGQFEVVLGGNGLIFKVCLSECDSEFLVCYESDLANQNVLDACDSGCGFYVTTKDGFISVMKRFTSFYQGSPKKNVCENIATTNGYTSFQNISISVCTPKIENGLVKLNVTTASSNCPVTIKNAHLKTDTTTAPPTTATLEHASATKGGNGNDTITEAPPTFMAQYWWIFLIIALVLVGGIVTGIVVYCVKCKKDKKSPDAAAAQQNIKESQSPAVQRSTPAGAQEDEKLAQLPQPSYRDESSILSRKSLLKTKKEEAPKESTDLRSVKPDA